MNEQQVFAGKKSDESELFEFKIKDKNIHTWVHKKEVKVELIES